MSSGMNRDRNNNTLKEGHPWWWDKRHSTRMSAHPLGRFWCAHDQPAEARLPGDWQSENKRSNNSALIKVNIIVLNNWSRTMNINTNINININVKQCQIVSVAQVYIYVFTFIVIFTGIYIPIGLPPGIWYIV